MTLPKALSQLTVTQATDIVSHLATHQSGYGNMHTREALKSGGKVVGTRHLQAIYAIPGGFEACMSGRGIYLHYEVLVVGGGVTFNVRADHVTDPNEEAHLEQSLVQEILDKVADERTRTQYYPPKRSSGSYYLQRDKKGMPATDPTCQRAVAAGVLHLPFVQKLQGWNFELLLHP